MLLLGHLIVDVLRQNRLNWEFWRQWYLGLKVVKLPWLQGLRGGTWQQALHDECRKVVLKANTEVENVKKVVVNYKFVLKVDILSHLYLRIIINFPVSLQLVNQLWSPLSHWEHLNAFVLESENNEIFTIWLINKKHRCGIRFKFNSSLYNVVSQIEDNEPRRCPKSDDRQFFVPCGGDSLENSIKSPKLIFSHA